MLRRLLLSLGTVVLLAASAGAETYPARTVTVIVPFPAGGPADIVGRIVADQLARKLNGTFVVENVNGAGGTVGSTRAARATPDGYTIIVGHMGTHAAAPALYPNLAYNPSTDFAPIGLVAELPEVLVTRKDLPPNNLQEFIAYAKANESKLNMAHAGVGSVSYVGCLLLNTLMGAHPTLVPFTGSTPATQALLAGQVDYFCDPIVGQAAHIRAGSLKGLALAAPQRHPLMPELPTAAEQGVPAFNIAPFFAVFAPRGTPQPILDALAAALDQGLDDPGVQKRFSDLGGSVAEKGRRGPAPLAVLVKSEMARLLPILQAQARK